MDGLMFNTEDVYWNTASTYLGRRGFVYTQELAEEIMGRQPRYCLERMIEYYDMRDTTWEELLVESEETFIKMLDDGFSKMPGLDNLLDFLEERNIPKAVCTSSTRRAAEEVLTRSGVVSRFRFVLTFEDVTQGKPNPEIYLNAAKRFGVENRNMIVFEDSISGSLAAKRSGAFTIVVLAEHNRTLDFSHADLVVESLNDPKVLKLLAPEYRLNE